MILLNFSKWQRAKGSLLIWERLLYKGYKWTPFCIVKRISKMEVESVDKLLYSVLFDFAGGLSITAGEKGLLKSESDFNCFLTGDGGYIQQFLDSRDIKNIGDFYASEITVENWDRIKNRMVLYLKEELK